MPGPDRECQSAGAWQKSLPPSAQGLSDPLQLSVSSMFLTALWEANHRRDSPFGLTWAGAKVCTGLADLAMHVCRGPRWVTLGCEEGRCEAGVQA